MLSLARQAKREATVQVASSLPPRRPRLRRPAWSPPFPVPSPSPTQTEKAARFRDLHTGPVPFVIPNPWDGGSARLLAAAGFQALATSSWAAAASYGRRDGRLLRSEAIAHVRLIVEATDLPVSGDLENGFGPSTDDVIQTLHQAVAAGLVGASIEDATGDARSPLYEFEHALDRIRAAVGVVRALPFPFVLTARAEGLIRGRPDLGDIIRRLQAFEEAGADVLFAPGLKDLASIETVCRSVSKPVNVMNALPQPFTIEQLAAVGVRRISLAASLYRKALTGVQEAAREMRDSGTFSFVPTSLTSAEVNGFLQE